MTNKSGLVAIGGAIVGALLVVLYFMVIQPAPLACNSAANCIPVYVINVNGKRQIQSIPDFERHGQGAIFWQIQTAGFTFPSDGIKFDKTPLPPEGEFTECAVMPGFDGKKFKCNAKGTRGTYGYTVKVTGSVAVPPLDPFVVNN
jgi:hypothetical protein